MSLFRWISEALRRGPRERLCAELRALGLDVSISERGRPEEGVSGGFMGNSLGLIAVNSGPIRWVNVLEHPASRYAAAAYTNILIVPDSHLRGGGVLELKSLRIRSAAVYGRMVDVRWRGSFVGARAVVAPEQPWDKDSEKALLARLNEDPGLQECLIRLGEDITVRSVPSHWCWAISSGSYGQRGFGSEPRRLAPSREQWDCYQTIARHLLAPDGQGPSSDDVQAKNTDTPDPKATEPGEARED